MARVMNTILFSADMDSLHRMLDFIETFLQSIQIDAVLKDEIILAAEEALVNIIQHGYSPGEKEGIIEISCMKLSEQPGLKIILKDHGVPFNPVIFAEEPHSIVVSDPSQLPLGGLGIKMLCQLMDQIEYQQVPGGNKLTLIKFF